MGNKGFATIEIMLKLFKALNYSVYTTNTIFDA